MKLNVPHAGMWEIKSNDFYGGEEFQRKSKGKRGGQGKGREGGEGGKRRRGREGSEGKRRDGGKENGRGGEGKEGKGGRRGVGGEGKKNTKIYASKKGKKTKPLKMVHGEQKQTPFNFKTPLGAPKKGNRHAGPNCQLHKCL